MATKSKTKDKKKKGSARSKGLSAKTYTGLSKKRMKKGTGGNKLQWKKGDSVTVQFLTKPDGMLEFDQHQFQDNGWNYVPCAGDDCPLCQDDDSDVSKTHYRFFANVWNFKTKKVEILEGPKTLSQKIMGRYEKKPKLFLSRTWDLDKLDQEPVTYDVDRGDTDAIKIRPDKHKLFDLNAAVDADLKRYFGDEIPASGSRTSMDDDDEDEDDAYDRDELEDMSKSEVKRIAKSLKIKLIDGDGDSRSTKTLIKLILKKQG